MKNISRYRSLVSCLVVAGLIITFSRAIAATPTNEEQGAFSDVSSSHWAFGCINNMVAANLVNGVGEGRFDPDGQLTTGQFIAIITRAFYKYGIPEVSTDDDWWEPNMQVAQDNGLLNGTVIGDTYDAPTRSWSSAVGNSPMTRYDMAKVIYNEFAAIAPSKLPTAAEIENVKNLIPDYESIPAKYKEAVTAIYATGCLTGVDLTGRFDGVSSVTRAAACVVLERMFVTVGTLSYTKKAVYPLVQVIKPEIRLTTPPTPETTTGQMLSNGKPVSDANIKEILEELRGKFPQGTEWSAGSKYVFKTTLFGYAGACNSFASMISDAIFGADAPVVKHQNFHQIKVGDVIWVQNSSNGYNHVMAVINVSGDYFESCSGNVNGAVSWNGGGTPSKFYSTEFSQTYIYSRY